MNDKKYTLLLMLSLIMTSVQAQETTLLKNPLNKPVRIAKLSASLAQVRDTQAQQTLELDKATRINLPKTALKDPTQINSNFKAKLRNLKSGHQEEASIATEELNIPKITLLARLKPRNKNIAALLEVEGKKMILSRGEFATFIQNNQIKEMHVNHLTNSLVELRIMPDEKIIRLH